MNTVTAVPKVVTNVLNQMILDNKEFTAYDVSSWQPGDLLLIVSYLVM